VEEKSNPNILLAQKVELFLKQFWKKHEMIIMYPYQVTLLGFLSNGLGEQEICLSIGIPGTLVKHNLTGVVV
jgi:hypothetical protein